MVHQPRRRCARSAGVLLGLLVLAAVTIGRMVVVPGHGPTARADTPPPAEAAGTTLDQRAEPVFVALNVDRADAGLAPLRLHAELTETAARDACAIARGDVPLSGDRARMTEAGGHRENVGMVIDDDPVAGARTMHDWWAHTRRHRRNRMDPEMDRYGIGACNSEDRTYYVERFAR
ncbi:MAG TPA: CAP domain-containing protein [Euzebyales bacterium]|nr:CAP domain-containing protein [Euzebyales bacterium]